MSKHVWPWGSSGKPVSIPARNRCVLLGAAVLAVIAACLAPPAWAEDAGPPVTKIEEDWVIQIGDPDAGSTAPQISIVTTPYDNLQQPYTVFELNNVTLPDYYGGGLQLQSWVDNYNTGSVVHDNFSSLSRQGEEIKFTVRMRMNGSSLRIRVVNGTSETWGSFGGTRMFQDLNTTLTNLNGYSPDNSAKFSRVGYAPNRVQLLQLKEVRYYSGTTLLRTDSQARNVASLSD